MSLCGDKELVVEWVNSDGQEQRFIGADDYLVENQTGRCPVGYDFFLLYSFLSNGNRSDQQQYMFTRNGPVLNVVPIADTSGNPHKAAGIVYTEDHPNGITYVKALSRGWILIEESVAVIFSRRDGQPDDCGGSVLKILKNGAVAYQEEFETTPSVSHYCDKKECPKGTCECVHGANVCCINSVTGEVVTEFRR